MTRAFADKYQATSFDLSDPNQAIAERARCAVLTAASEAISSEDDSASRQMEYLLAGLLVGVVQVVQASADGSPDTVDPSIRASIVQASGWAVDTARAMQGRDPLSDQT